jgi:hypothetical protein
MMLVENLIWQRADRPLERMMLDEYLIRLRAVRPLERMNSPLGKRKVRLRGLGGPALKRIRSPARPQP